MEQKRVVVESSLPSGSPARVSQAESPTFQTIAAFDTNGNIATEQVAEIRIDVVESSTLPISPAHVPQAESSTSSRNPPFDNGNMATEQEEDISIVVESSTLPSPAYVPQAESFTSNRNSPFEGMPIEPAATEEIVVETSPAATEEIVVETSPTATEEIVVETSPAATEEIAVETSPANSMSTEPAATEEIAVETSPAATEEIAAATEEIAVETSPTATEEITVETSPVATEEIAVETSPANVAEKRTGETSAPRHTKDTRFLCLAAVKAKWEITRSIILNDRKLLSVGLTREGDTVLHIAVTGKCLDFVRKLVDLMRPDEMLTRNFNNDTALHIAAVSGKREIARLIVEKNRDLLMFRGTDDSTPLAMAIQSGHRKMVDYLYGCTELDNLADDEYISLVLDSLSSKLYDTALELLNRRETMAYEHDSKTGKTALHVLAQEAPPEVTTVSYGLRSIVENFYTIAWKLMTGRTTVSDLFKNIRETSDESADGALVLSKILDVVMRIASEDITDLIRTPSNVIFDATMSGNVQFLAELFRRYPEQLWERDERRRSVFHVAVVYRQEKVFNLIYNAGAVKDYLVGIEDSDGNNMLHLAGMSSENKEKLGGLRANLLMQQEILWFKEVEKIVRPDQRNKKNSGGKTPREVFIEAHSGMLRGGEDTIKGTAKSCMLVATLIATVVFAAPLNVQGMNSPSKKLQSWIFALSNAAALCSSTSSIVVSLSILTSSYAQSDFLDSLHRRLIIALTTLFVSIATMVTAFGAAMFVIFDGHVPLLMLTATIPFACLPVMLFLMFHGDLFSDLIRSYRWSKSLFKPSVYKIFV